MVSYVTYQQGTNWPRPLGFDMSASGSTNEVEYVQETYWSTYCFLFEIEIAIVMPVHKVWIAAQK